jgi:hypothetical protein
VNRGEGPEQVRINGQELSYERRVIDWGPAPTLAFFVDWLVSIS